MISRFAINSFVFLFFIFLFFWKYLELYNYQNFYQRHITMKISKARVKIFKLLYAFIRKFNLIN